VSTPALHLTSDEILIPFLQIQRLMLFNAAQKISSVELPMGRFLRTAQYGRAPSCYMQETGDACKMMAAERR
jgi:hypothetical protein